MRVFWGSEHFCCNVHGKQIKLVIIQQAVQLLFSKKRLGHINYRVRLCKWRDRMIVFYKNLQFKA